MMDDKVEQFRQFNRFHTRLVGALNESLLASEFTLPECRVLYEVASAPDDQPISARQVGENMEVNKGYLSRLVNGLEKRNMIERVPSKVNAKKLELKLTKNGAEIYNALNKASAKEVEDLLLELTEAGQNAVIRSMDNIRRLLGDLPDQSDYIIRDPRPGDFGAIIAKHGQLYVDEYGWDWTFEGFVAEIIGQFSKNYDPKFEKCWVAEMNGELIGSIFVVKGDDTDTAKLRMLFVDQKARGLGLGSKLVTEAINFAKDKKYKRMILWTNDILHSARKIYEANDFELIEEEKHHSFGQDLVGQIWARDL